MRGSSRDVSQAPARKLDSCPDSKDPFCQAVRTEEFRTPFESSPLQVPGLGFVDPCMRSRICDSRSLRPEPLAEVHAAGLGVGDDLGRSARRNRLAVVDEVGVVGDGQSVTDVVVGDDDADAAVS